MEVGDESSNNNISRVRIHVGGLGEGVTRDDLCNLFSKVGIGFESVDIIRTKGRSFAYVNFLPSSLNSLSKLFTTYNGCVWKGGKLRLEKAKEHYLDRLKREWDEDAQVSTNTITNDAIDKKTESLEKPNKVLGSETKQLRIFFPRLQKLKPIPFSGTGKHKYSFRRVEVPSLPMYFCDCEEHSGRLHSAEIKQISFLEEQGGVMNQEEVDMMNAVMNRLFEMENVSGPPPSDIEPTKEEDYSAKAADEQLYESEGCSTADDDDLITNVVNQKKETAFTNQESNLNKRKASEDRPTQQVLKKRTRYHRENDTNEYVSAILQDKGSLHDPSSGPEICSSAQCIESQSAIKRSASGVSWSQKSSWRELVGNKSNSAVNISGILPGILSNKEEETKSDTIQNPDKSKKKKLLTCGNQSSQLDEPKEEVLTEAPPTKLDSGSNKEGRGSAWLHKASWTQLVTGNSSSSFSITQIFPGVTFEKQEPAKSDFDVIAVSRDYKHDGTVDESGSSLDGPTEFRIGRNDDVERTPKSSQFIVMDNNHTLSLTENQNSTATEQKSTEVAAGGTCRFLRPGEFNSKASTLTENKTNSATKKKGGGVVAVGEHRPFVRTEESVKEWANIRAALSGSRKKTSKGK